jgi:predicted transcriptional regulator
MVSEESKQRVNRINVRLQPEMSEKLERLAMKMGIAPATLGAVAIAEYVNGKLAQSDMMERTAQLTAERSGDIMEQMLSSPEFLGLMTDVAEQDDQPRLEGV